MKKYQKTHVFFAFCYKIKRICYMRQRAFSLKTVPLPQNFLPNF